MRHPIYHLSLAFSLALLCLAAHPAMATNRTVYSSADSGPGTLRDIIAVSADGDTIDFAVGGGCCAGHITLTSGELLIAHTITINGVCDVPWTVQRSTASGTPNFRIFNISNGTTSGPTVTFSRLTIANGQVSGSGGGILSDHAALTLTNCTVNGNSATNGGGIYNNGLNSGSAALSVLNSTISGNNASAGGGGLYNAGNSGSANVTLSNSALSGNNGDSGGAILNYAGALTAINSTLSGNSAFSGGAIYNLGGTTVASVTLRSCTVGGNSGGGIRNDNFGSNPTLTLSNTLLKTGSSGANLLNTSGTITSQGHNLSNDAAGGDTATGPGGFLNATGDIRNTDPMLGPLQDNGGPTQTMALLSGSVAIDAGDDAVLGPPLNLTTDQRGLGFPRQLGAHVDIGAFEFDNVPHGGTFIVTNPLDHDDGVCDGGDCTLREAINAANAASSAHSIIRFNIPTTNCGHAWTISLTSALPDLSTNIEIDGPGAGMLTVQRSTASGTPDFRIFNVTTTGAVTFSGFTIFNGNITSGDGGGISNNTGTVTVTNCTLSNNFASGGQWGGGISNDSNGTVNVTNCTLSFNQGSVGGGISNTGTGTVTVTNCMLSNNTADMGGGGIWSGGTLAVTNSTLGGNFASGNVGNGGAIYTSGAAAVTNSTISGNSAVFGGGIYIPGGTVTVTNSTLSSNSVRSTSGQGGGIYAHIAMTVKSSIIAGNFGTGGPDVYGSFTTQGFNLIGKNDGAATSFPAGNPNANNDIVGTSASPIDPKLGGLFNNGGATQTMALFSGSPAINKGDPNAPPQDQRYYLRSGVPDIGAFEFGGALAPVSVASRKMHGSAGTFDINLPLTGHRGVECRTGGVTQVVFTFPTAVTINTTAGTQGAMVSSGTGSVTSTSGSSTTGTPVVTVNLTGVTNIQYITLTLFGVNDGTNTNNVAATMGVLVGDVNSTGLVDGNDVSAVQAQARQTANSTNFRLDVNATGLIDGNDVSLVQSKTRTSLPSPP